MDVKTGHANKQKSNHVKLTSNYDLFMQSFPVLNTPLRKIPRSFQNVIQIKALQFRLGFKFIRERNQRF